ncbi:hypothetical protein [Yersinia hibernica]|uniref:hypothetical protein n=1 Tax=Yersinia hibernica TaxID=2339259 RepID=UPI0011A77395|nr:hypothetical protein [Yersinia hibernica]
MFSIDLCKRVIGCELTIAPYKPFLLKLLGVNMGFNVASIRSAITTAVKHTNADGRFHKADMKSLAGLMKEIKNSSNFMKMDNQIPEQDADKFTNNINSMIKTLNSQGSGMHKEKMGVLTELKTQLKSITSQNSNKGISSISDKEIKAIKQQDDKYSFNLNVSPSLSLGSNTPSHRQDCN